MEGSLRVPFMLRWPGRVSAGVATTDRPHHRPLPTLACMVGARARTDRAVDGVDQLDFFWAAQSKSNL